MAAMSEIEKIAMTAVASGGVGYVAGMAQMWWRNRREDRVRREDELHAFGEAFLAMREKDKNLAYSAEARLGALQNLGAYRFSKSEIFRFQNAIIARGFPDPISGHSQYLSHLPDYPLSVFHWASEHRVALGDEVSVLEALVTAMEKLSGSLSIEQDQRLLRWQLALEIARGNR